MPYIKQEDRALLDAVVAQFTDAEGLKQDATSRLFSEGEMNYLITKIIHIWLNHRGLNYSSLNAAIGVLECAKQELYRQIAAPYEDKKKQENGPVSNLDR